VTHPDHLADEELSARVDDQLSPDEAARVQAHLGSCLACQARLDELNDLVGLLRALPSAEPARDFRLGPRLVADPPNVIRLRRWYAWSRVAAGALAAVFVFLSVGTLYVDSRPLSSTATLASKAQPAPELATAPQNPAAPAAQNSSAPAARNATGGAASDAAAPAPPAAAPAAQPPAAPAPASAARPAAVPAASAAAQAPATAAGAAPAPAVRSQAAPAAPTSTEPDQIAAATTIRPLPTQVPTPTIAAQAATPFASAAPSPQQTDPAAPFRTAASVVGVLAAFGILLALFVRHRLQAASPSHLE
jgi:hypothetical protein